MKYVLKEMGLDEKPRSKMKRFGVTSLSDYELLSVIIKSGIKDKSVIDLSIEILSYFSNLSCLEEATLEELEAIKGLGEAKSLELLACIELGRRIYNENSKKVFIKTARDAYCYIKSDLQNLNQENFVCLYLNVKGQVIAKKVISIGSVDKTTADYKSAIKWALKFSASGIIYIHNHPSGNPSPSSQDYELTNLFESITESVDLLFIDHIIIGKNSYFSFKRGDVTSL